MKSLFRNSLAGMSIYGLLWIAVYPAIAQKESKTTAPAVSTPKLSDATAISEKSSKAVKPIDALTSKQLPSAFDEAKAAQEKRAREAARLRGEITFDDLKFDIEKDGLFDPSMLTKDIRELHQKKVRIRGFMLPSSVFQTEGIQQFVLVRDNQECCFGPGAAIYDCIMIEMAAGKTTSFNLKVMTVSGVLSIDTESYQYPDGGHYAIYKIVASEAK